MNLLKQFHAIFCIALNIMCLLLISNAYAEDKNLVLQNESFTQYDSILVIEEGVGEIKSWQASKQLVPASLTKLPTAYLALDKWGGEYSFHTDFYRKGTELWVKGFGDPYLVSEELDRLAVLLKKLDLTGIESFHIDDSYFVQEIVPGRTTVNDPYNAPVSAVAANFNTVMLRKIDGQVASAETQTPLTPVAVKISKGLANTFEAQRVNLKNRLNAQTHFAELLLIKLGQVKWEVHVNDQLPKGAERIFRYENTHTVENIIRGMLEFSNNFMANQLFLALGGSTENRALSFGLASDYAQNRLVELFSWKHFSIVEGSGLSRENQLSARQIADLLDGLEPYKKLFKHNKNSKAEVYAKTGTLNDVRTFAGFIALGGKDYRFVFMFNRKVPWRHREKLLEKLVGELVQRQSLASVTEDIDATKQFGIK